MSTNEPGINEWTAHATAMGSDPNMQKPQTYFVALEASAAIEPAELPPVTHEYIAEKTGYSLRVVDDAMARLVKLGYFEMRDEVYRRTFPEKT